MCLKDDERSGLIQTANLLLLVLQLLHGSAQHPAHRSPKEAADEAAGSQIPAFPLPEAHAGRPKSSMVWATVWCMRHVCRRVSGCQTWTA